jgi:hypothetical protein
MKLLVDIDGTLRNVWPTVNAYILDATGVELPATWPEYDIARTTVGDAIAEAAFEAVCGTYSAGDVWYPGAWDAIHDLEAAGITPIFCTLNTVRQSRTIARELEDVYGKAPLVERVLNSANKLKVARRTGAVGIVDDKPGTLEAFRAAGMFTATYDHPYNRNVDVDYRFKDWRRSNLAEAVYNRVWTQLSIDCEAAV